MTTRTTLERRIIFEITPVLAFALQIHRPLISYFYYSLVQGRTPQPRTPDVCFRFPREIGPAQNFYGLYDRCACGVELGNLLLHTWCIMCDNLLHKRRLIIILFFASSLIGRALQRQITDDLFSFFFLPPRPNRYGKFRTNNNTSTIKQLANFKLFLIQISGLTVGDQVGESSSDRCPLTAVNSSELVTRLDSVGLFLLKARRVNGCA